MIVGDAQNLIAIIKTLVHNDVLISMNVMITTFNFITITAAYTLLGYVLLNHMILCNYE